MFGMHYAETLGKDSVEKMGKALSIVQEALAKMTVRGICAEQQCIFRMLTVTENISVSDSTGEIAC